MPTIRDRFVELGFGRRLFADRETAGRLLARELTSYAGTHPIVLGLPRGGLPVADEVARALDGTLDVWVVRKLGVPYQPELAMGAIAEGPAVVLDRRIVVALGITGGEVCEVARREMAEMERRIVRFRGGLPAPELRDRVVMLVDDGIATGSTMRAAIRAVSKRRPARVVVATPVASPDVADALRRVADDVVCVREVEPLVAIGLAYEDFQQLDDAEVARILERARRERPRSA